MFLLRYFQGRLAPRLKNLKVNVGYPTINSYIRFAYSLYPPCIIERLKHQRQIGSTKLRVIIIWCYLYVFLYTAIRSVPKEKK